MKLNCKKCFLAINLALLSSLLANHVSADDEINVKLRIESKDATIIDQTISLPPACSVVDTTTTTPHEFTGYKAICVLEQAKNDGLITSYQVTDWGFAFAIDEIHGIANAADWSETWLIYKNYADPGVGIDGFSLGEGDDMLFTYGAWPMVPLKLNVPATSTEVGENVVLSAQTWDSIASNFANYDGNTTTFHIGDSSHESASGTLSWTPSATGTIKVWSEAGGMTRSAVSSIIVNQTTDNDENDDEDINEPIVHDISYGKTPLNASDSAQEAFNTNTAIQFLANNQNTDGSFGDSVLFADWTAVSFGAHGQNVEAKNKLKDYLLTDPSPLVGMNKTTDYVRRAMALMALNINPRTDTKTDYITKIVNNFDGQQFGEVNLVNDDIFALFPLLKAGHSVNDSLIKKTVSFILSQQEESGSWGSVDLTSAGIQALKMVESIEGVPASIASAKSYLALQQKIDGGFGDVYGTSWAIQAIAALNENPENWKQNYKNPMDYLASKQSTSDGGFLEGNANNNRIWATAYVVPAILKKTWTDILNAFEKPTVQITETQQQPSGGFTIQPTSEELPSPASAATSTAISTIQTETATSTVEAEKNSEAETGTIKEKKPSDTVVDSNVTKISTGNTAKEQNARMDQATRAGAGGSRVIMENTTVKNGLKTEKTADAKKEVNLEAKNQNSASEQPKGETIAEQVNQPDEITAASPVQKTARKVFGGALAATVAMGSFIALRFALSLL